MKKFILPLLFLSLFADAQNSHYPPANGGGGGGVTSVTATAPISSSGGATPNISESQSTTSTDGWLSSIDWNTFNNKQPAGNYANQSLSNLTSPTALNQDLIFNEGTNAQIKTADSSSGPSYNLNLFTGDGTGVPSGSFSIGAGNSDTQSAGNVEFGGGNVTSATSNASSGGQTSIFGGNTSSTNINAQGGAVFIVAGHAPIPANSGSVSIYDGNDLAGFNIGPNVGMNIFDDAGYQGASFLSTDREIDNAAGNPTLNFTTNLVLLATSPNVIQFQDGSQGTAGYVWTSTDTLGSGSWMPSGGGGANTALSNLVSTAVNAAINPGVANTISQGTTALPFLNIEANSFTLGDGTNDLFSISQVTSSNIEFQGAPSTNTITTSFEGGTNTGSGAGGSLVFGAQGAGPSGGNGGDVIFSGADAGNPASSGGNVVALISSPSGGGPSGEVGLSGHISYDPGGTYGFSTPSAVTPQTGLGSGATASVSGNSQDMGGVLTFTSGTTGLAAGAEVVVTFGIPYNSGETPVVQLTPSDAAGAIAYYVTSTATDFTVHFVAAPILSTTYSYNYAVVGLL